MLKITIIDTRDRRRLVLGGKLVAPWVAELRREYREAAADLRGRQIVIEPRNVTYISEEGENLLLELMNEGVGFRCSGVLTKHVMKRLACRSRKNIQGERREEHAAPLVRVDSKFRQTRNLIAPRESAVELALREALSNAVVHGNRLDAHKLVHVRCHCRVGNATADVRSDSRGS